MSELAEQCPKQLASAKILLRHFPALRWVRPLSATAPGPAGGVAHRPRYCPMVPMSARRPMSLRPGERLQDRIWCRLRECRERPSRGSLLRREYRSEEHTSELQSLMRISYAVFFLKKTTKKQQTTCRAV